MKLFVGLGNPGAKYAATRHNVGWMAVDAIAETHGFSPWRSKFQGQLCEGRLGDEKVWLLKPETFMNLSGQSVGAALRFHKLAATDVTVFHDEIDLTPGKLRVKQGGGHAGHNGLRSLHQHLGADYERVRIGVGHPGDKNLVADWVLHEFAKADRDWLDPMLEGIAEGAPKLAAGDAAGFQNAVALRMKPAKGPKPAAGPDAETAPSSAAETALSPPVEKDTGRPASPFDLLRGLLRR